MPEGKRPKPPRGRLGWSRLVVHSVCAVPHPHCSPLCYIDAMSSKYLAIAAALLSVALAPAVSAAQANKKPAPANQTAPASTAAPAHRDPGAPAQTTPGTPATAQPSTPAANPSAAPANPNCLNGPCDYQPPHITSVNPPPPVAGPWTLQDRIKWLTVMLLVLVAYVGVLLAVSTLRKIERQMHHVETAAQAAADSAKALLLHADAQVKADRPWILVTAEPTPGAANGFTVVATNRGRSPARIVTLADEIAIAKDESQLPPAPAFKTGPRAPLAPIILLPGESAGLKSFTREEVNSVCADAEQLRRVEDWDEKIYLYGTVTYVDLLAPGEEQAHETAWCCWYIHGRQKSGMVMASPPEYSRHT